MRADLCMLTGAVSGNLEMIDFDFEGELFPAWAELVETEVPGLLDRLVVERSQSGGRHVVYRCEAAIPGNLKLAQRVVAGAGRPGTRDLRQAIPPAAGGRSLRGHLHADRNPRRRRTVPVPPDARLRPGTRQLRVPAGPDRGRAENPHRGRMVAQRGGPRRGSRGRADAKCAAGPGDEFNERGDVRALLVRHGWQCVGGGENERWRRPGKDQGWSATLRDRVFYVFSSNAAPFEPNHPYSPFAVYALLEHQGDFAQAASALRGRGFWRGRSGRGARRCRYLGPGGEARRHRRPIMGRQFPILGRSPNTFFMCPASSVR